MEIAREDEIEGKAARREDKRQQSSERGLPAFAERRS